MKWEIPVWQGQKLVAQDSISERLVQQRLTAPQQRFPRHCPFEVQNVEACWEKSVTSRARYSDAGSSAGSGE